MQTVSSLPAIYNNIFMFMHSLVFVRQTLVICADVLGCSGERQYQCQVGGESGGAEYQLVTLRLPVAGPIAGSDPSAAETGSAESTGTFCIAYLILFDDQVVWELHIHVYCF
jgi:hypothetical protein